MSVSFTWKLPAAGQDLRWGTPNDVTKLSSVFGEPPWVFGPDHWERLDAMATVAGDSSVYREIADLLLQYYRIEVTGDYG